MSLLDALTADIQKLTQVDGDLTYYCCHDCGETYGSNSGPKTTCDCGSTGFQYPGKTRDEAKERRAAALAPATPAPTVDPIPAAPAPEKKKRVTKVQEKAPETPVAQAPAPQVHAEAVDAKAEREARVSAFILKHNLNEFQPVEMGTAKVQAVGFTLWIRDDKGSRPVYRIQESFESAADFRIAYDEARAQQPATRIDVAACNKVSNPELEACLYRGDLMASLNSGHGTIQVRRGDIVRIGVYKTKEGRLRFAVID